MSKYFHWSIFNLLSNGRPNGKAEPQRRVGGSTTLNKYTNEVKKPRYNLREAQANARRRESGAVGVGRWMKKKTRCLRRETSLLVLLASP
jgi:hypothetical protein